MSNLSSSCYIEHIPKIRFSGFSVEWEDCVLSNVLTERKEYCEKDGTYEHATLSKDGIYGKTDRYNRDFLVADKNKRYKITKRWDLCYNPANLKFGAICLNTYGDAIFSPIYVTFDISNSFSKEFIGYSLSRWNFINRALRFQQGTVYERMAVSPEDFLTIHCRFPKIKEQEKIADFLRLIDQRIAKHTEYVEHLKKYKRGVSNKLFEENSYAWNIALFVDIFEFLQNTTCSRDELCFNETKIMNIHYGDILTKYREILDLSKVYNIPFIKNSVDLTRYIEKSYLKNGDVIFTDTAEDYTVGKAIEVCCTTDKKILSGLHTIPCRPLINFEKKYLGYYLNSYSFRKQILPLIQGTKVSSISKSELQKVKIKFPEHREQRKISSILSSIDNRRYIAEQELIALNIYRKGLIQQLFI